MAEFALRGYNVAMPEMDIGDDIFAVNDQTGTMWRIQVKTGVATVGPNKTWSQFRVRRKAITTPSSPELHFVFVLRAAKLWHYVVVARNVLEDRHVNQGLGTISTSKGQQWVTLTFSLTPAKNTISCSKQDVTGWLDNWAVWPELK